MSFIPDDFNYERAFAVNVAASQFPTFAAYANEQRLFERFSPEQVAQIRAVYEHWHSIVRASEHVTA